MLKPLQYKQYVITAAVLAAVIVGCFILVGQFSNLGQSIRLFRQANPWLVFAALMSSLISTALSAEMYNVLSLRPLHRFNTVLVEVCGLCVNRIIPAGVGGLSLNFLYLRTQKHTTVQAGAVVIANNVLGLVGHLGISLIVLAILFSGHNNVQIVLPKVSLQTALIGAALVVAGIIGYVVYTVYRPRQAKRLVKHLRTTLRQFREHQRRLIIALFVSMAMTSANVMSLWFCCQSLGIGINVVTLFLVYSIGVIAGTATPTPGGLGGIEAALVAGLVTQHIAFELAFAAILLYRLVSFWFGLVIGAVALLIVRQRQIVTFV